MINFNEKNCVKIVSFYNKLRLDLNGEEKKLEKRELKKYRITNGEKGAVEAFCRSRLLLQERRLVGKMHQT